MSCNNSKTALLRQSFSISGTLLLMFSSGCSIGYPAALMSVNQAEDSPIAFSQNQASWIASMTPIASLVGFLLYGPVMEKFGRKLVYFAVNLPLAIGWILTAVAWDLTPIYIARGLQGIGFGGCFVLSIIIGEFSSPEHRGMFLNMKSGAFSAGFLIIHVLGATFDWRVVAWVNLIPCLVSFLIGLAWKESPSWLAHKGRFDECEEAFYWLRGKSFETDKELRLLILSQQQKFKESKKQNGLHVFLDTWVKAFRSVDFWKAVLIVTFSMILVEAGGRHFFPTYAFTILQSFTKGSMNPFYCVFVIDSVQLVSVIASCYIIMKFNKRVLLLSSGFLSAFLLLVISLLMYLKASKIMMYEALWLNLILFLVYIVVINLGILPIGYSFLGEIFSLEHRGVGSCVGGIAISVTYTIAVKITPSMIDTWDVHGTYFAYALIMVVSLLYLYVALPETKDKTLLEIEEKLKNKPVVDQNLKSDDDNVVMLEKTEVL